VAVIAVGTWCGYWLDNRMALRAPIFTLLGALVSLAAAMFYLHKQLK